MQEAENRSWKGQSAGPDVLDIFKGRAVVPTKWDLFACLVPVSL